MGKGYSFSNYGKGNMARAIGRSLPISFKQSIEICNFIRNKEIVYAKNVLNKAIERKRAIPFRRFNHNMGHKKKIGAGRYPEKASREILELINQVEANAQFKGLNSSNLVITHINSNKAATVMHYGRKRSRKAKRTNIEIIVQEKLGKKIEGSGSVKKKTRENKSTEERKTENTVAAHKKEEIKRQIEQNKMQKQEVGKISDAEIEVEKN